MRYQPYDDGGLNQSAPRVLGNRWITIMFAEQPSTIATFGLFDSTASPLIAGHTYCMALYRFS